MISLLLALAVVQAAPTDPVGAAVETFSACVRAKAMAAPASLPAQAAADSAWKACEADRAAVEKALEVMIAPAPPEVQTKARSDFAAVMARGRADLAQALGSMRATAK